MFDWKMVVGLMRSGIVWVAAQEQQEQMRTQAAVQRSQVKDEAKAQREEMRKELLGEK